MNDRLQNADDAPPLLSVVIPVFNEQGTIRQIVEKVEQALDGITHEILVVDDGSTDGSAEQILNLNHHVSHSFRHTVNRGKGAALRTAFQACCGEIVVIQDADLEYDPRDISRLITPIVDGKADVVFGSRFHGEAQRVSASGGFYHRIGNAVLTFLSNLMTNLNLSDMECGYKAFRREVLAASQTLIGLSRAKLVAKRASLVFPCAT